MKPAAFFNTIGGLPFIDDGVHPGSLLAAVACGRRNSAPDAHEALTDYLDPENARALFKRLASSQVDELDSTQCSAVERRKIATAIARIGMTSEAWRGFFAIPIRYRKLFQPMSSSTSALIPQTIYLGSRAFDSPVPLEETLVHEHAHIWLNFVMEVYDLQTQEAPRDYVLPSGTSGKTLRGVMAAAHFAAAALKYYRCQHNPTPSKERQAYLHKYLAGCLDIAAQRPCFTPMGRLVFSSLNDFYQDLTVCPEGN
ncbi:aKG-HExxH-type peptide beta-hydroxylase [Pseudomonas sp. ABY48]|uniref:aKG-HExxH-type peptide beta-hydroxylase n=1 Tax=Pseudomonas sp. ABY48 TaxID=3402865 RepID=UPI003B42C94F